MLAPNLSQCCFLAAILTLSGAGVSAQETTQSPCDPACQLRVETKWKNARQLSAEGQHVAAAQAYASVIQEEPLSIISLDAAFRAGQALETAGNHAEAVQYYDTAVSIADARSSETGSKAVTLKKIKRAALFARARALKEAGQQEAAAQADQRALDNAFADFSTISATMKQEDARTLQADAMTVGQDLEQSGNLEQAIAVYDRIIAIGDTRADTADGENVFAILDAKRDALFKKADACRRAGRVNDASQSIQRIRAEFPVSSAAYQVGVVEAQLNGTDTQQAELVVTKELEAKPILDEAIESAGPDGYGVHASRPISCTAGPDGLILVRVKIKGAKKGYQNLWNLWIDDADGKNLARCYGSGSTIRGRIGSGSDVTEQTVPLTGEWDDLQIKIVPAANMTEFLLNGKSFGVLSHIGAGEGIAKLRIERVDNPLALDDFVEFDDLAVSGGNPQPFIEAFNYPVGDLNGKGGWTGPAKQEIFITQGALRVAGGQYGRALQLLQQVIENYPDTTAYLVALDKKGRLLQRLKKFAEAKTALTIVLDRLRPASSQSEFFQTARVRLKRFVSEWIAHDLQSGETVTEERYTEFRALCSEIIAQDTRPDERAQAHNSIAETFTWQRRYPEALAIAEAFLAAHDPQEFPYQTVWAHLYAGIGCQEVGRYDDSLVHLRWLTTEHPGYKPESPLGKEVLPHAYYRIWNCLKRSGAPAANVSQAFNEYASKYPEAAKAIAHLQPEQ